MTGVLIRRGEDTQGEDSHVTMGAEIGVEHLQPKECLGLPEAGRGKGGSSPGGFRGNMAPPTP